MLDDVAGELRLLPRCLEMGRLSWIIHMCPVQTQGPQKCDREAGERESGGPRRKTTLTLLALKAVQRAQECA